MKISTALAFALGSALVILAQSPQDRFIPGRFAFPGPANPLNDPEAVRPIDAADSVWLEELTWMEVRDAIRAGKTTILIPTGGIEQSGPYLALGKHNYVLKATAEAIARKLGNSLVAPIVPFTPEGGMDPKTYLMVSPGTITMRDETYEAMLRDVGESLKQHGFKNVVFIGDSGENLDGMRNTAERLNRAFSASGTRFHFVPEYYNYSQLTPALERMGIKQTSEGLHDMYAVTAMMMAVDPNTVRIKQREKAGKATINGVSILPAARTVEVGKQLITMRAQVAVDAISKAIATTK